MRKEHVPIVISGVSFYAIFFLLTKTEIGNRLLSVFQNHPILISSLISIPLVIYLRFIWKWGCNQYNKGKVLFRKQKLEEEDDDLQQGLFEGLLFKDGKINRETYLGTIISSLIFIFTIIVFLFLTDQNVISKIFPTVSLVPRFLYYFLTLIGALLVCPAAFFISLMFINLLTRIKRKIFVKEGR